MTGSWKHLGGRAAWSGAAAVVAGLLLAGCTGGTTSHRTTSVPAGALTLVAFDSCDDLLNGLRAAAKSTVSEYGLPGAGAFGIGGPVPAIAPGVELAPDNRAAAGAAVPGAAAPGAVPDGATGPAFSGTNTAEAGVDEPDIVKTDGKRIVAVANTVLTVVDPQSRKVTGTLPLGEGAYATDLLLSGDHALLLMPTGGIDDVAGPRLVLVDVSGAPKILSTYAMDGSLLDARQVGGTVRVVVRSTPRLNLPQLENATSQQRLDANRAAIDQAQPADWLPRYAVTTGGKTTRGSVPCNAVSRPADYSGAATLTLLTFNLDADAFGSGDPVTIVADGTMVYSNGPSLYIVNDNRWRVQPLIFPVVPNGTPGLRPSPPAQRTDLYQFDTGGTGKAKYLGAGSVPGYALNQYALSEWQGNLRVATTNGDSSTVYVLHRSGDALHEVGSVGGLGKGQRIYAVRFDAGNGYVVTFRQTDPLYTLDLRDAAHPKVTGSLEINGYSAYLHPLGNGRLIGVGQEADANGRVQGTQVSLFDVSDPAAPKRLAQFHVQYGHSAAEFDPHAFLYWPATGLLVIPMTSMVAMALPGATINGGATGSGGAAVGKVAPTGPVPFAPEQVAGAVALHVTDGTITQLGTVSHDNSVISRSLVIDRTLWTVSQTGLGAYDLGTLATQGWVGF
jgi:hypothetical protein